MATAAAAALVALSIAAPPSVTPVNIIDGRDDRDSILAIGPGLGLTPREINRIRHVSGYVGCLSPSPAIGGGALFITNDQILTAAHIFYERSGAKRSNCFFRAQTPDSERIDILLDAANARFGGNPPRPGSNKDYAIVRLARPLSGQTPFPVETTTGIAAGDRLIVVTPHPVGMEHLDKQVPVAQPCTVRRVPISSGVTNFFRTDCDATGSSSGGMHLSRVNGRLVFRGITISTGPWRDPNLKGAAYDERGGSVTTALGTDAAILEAGLGLAAR
jgi:hypothetical protein